MTETDTYWTEDAVHPHEDWQYEVANGDTLLGYHEWVAKQRADADKWEES